MPGRCCSDPGHHRGGSRDRKIVVGVDGSTGSEAAPAFAFDEASRRQTELCAIHVFDPSTVQIMANLPQADLRRLHLAASETLSNLLATRASTHPCVHAWGHGGSTAFCTTPVAQPPLSVGRRNGRARHRGEVCVEWTEMSRQADSAGHAAAVH
jgi:hypothetical protein